ncbi:unnamed protein product [Parnassius mnemosyne]|uniref:RNase H type-1 domain-containing protein n=1 Tax=Parnassius mnemosyne TaxID=213953 RepID=A0AAV1K5R6_9NEOP
MKKSLNPPTGCLEYLGLMWDTQNNKTFLPDRKIAFLKKDLEQITRSGTWSWVSGKRLVGKLAFASFTVPLGRLHSRHLQRAARNLPQHQKNHKYLTPPKALQECVWWLENLQKDRQIFASVETIFVTTDASDTGWGAQVNKRLLNGLWKTNQTLWHINRKELYAIYQAVLLTLTQLRGKRVVIQSDNKTAVSYIRNQGGTKSVLLTELVSKILELAYENEIEIFAYYIPGVFNEMADSLSRQKHLADWHLSNKVTDLLFKKWGTPQVDLFATAFSKVVPIYVSRDTTDKCALFIDAFSRIWDFDLAWIFPPPGLMPRVLAHLNKARGTYILVAPRWERVFWRADLRRRALDRPICIRNLQHHLSDATQNVPLPDARNLRLEAWLIRGGQKSHLHGPKKTLNYSKDLGESLL